MTTVPVHMGVQVPRLRLTRRGRLVLVLLVSIPLVVTALFFATNGGGAVATIGGSGSSFEYVTVQAGQSLWQLAAQVAPQADPRDVVADIRDLNQLTTSDLQPGDRLAIPQQYSH